MKAILKTLSLVCLLMTADLTMCPAQKHTLYCMADVATSDLFNTIFYVKMDYGRDSLVEDEVGKCFSDVEARKFSSVAAVIQAFANCGWELVTAYTSSGKDRFPKLIFKKQS